MRIKRPGISLATFWILLVLAAFGLLNVACDFEPEGTHYREVPEPVGEMPTADLSFKDSVLYLDGPTLFEYSLSFLNQEVYYVDFYVNGKKIESLEGPVGSLMLDLAHGEYLFEMVVYSSTESGTIADRVSAEVFTYGKTWTIYADDENSCEIQIQSIEKDGGSLRIDWEKYEGYNFYSYELYKNTYIGEVFLFRTLEMDQTSFTDPYHMGGPVEYFVRSQKYSGEKYDGDIAKFNGNPDSISCELNWVEHSITISWPRCGFDANYGSYQVYRRIGGGAAETIYDTNEINDTTFTVAVGENQMLVYGLRYRSRMPDATSSNGVYVIQSDIIFTPSF